MISLTVFDNLWDNDTSNRVNFNSFNEFEKAIFHLSTIDGYKPKKGENVRKRSSPLISPAIYSETTRKNINVIEWAGWAALDIDNAVIDGSIQDAMFAAYSVKFICHSTSSSSIEHPKFRLIFPLSRHVTKEEIPHFWYALNLESGNAGDKQTKDLSRMFYVPAKYPKAYNFIFTNDSSEYMDVDALLLKHPYSEPVGTSFMDRLPEAMQKAIIANRVSKLNQHGNTSYTWTSYNDCPFVNHRLIDEYKAISHTDGAGRYSMIYKILSSIAFSAIKKGYPITEYELSDLVKQLDRETSNRYQKRPLLLEAGRAIEYAYRNADI